MAMSQIKNKSASNSTQRTGIAMVLFATVLMGCGNDNSIEVIEEVYRPVRAMTVTSGLNNNALSFSGLVKAGQESELSFRVAGTIKSLPAKIGMKVDKGDLLAELDQSDYNISYHSSLANQKNAEAAMQSTKAQIKSAESERIRSKAAYERSERLYETNSISLSEFEQARAAWQAADASYRSSQLQYSSAKAQLDAAKQQTNSSKNQLTYTKLVAPYNGVVSQVLVDQNEQLAAGAPAVVLSADNKSEIEVGLPANVISQVKEGDKVSVNFFNISNQTFSAVITEVGYTTANSAVYPLIVQLEQSSQSILPGMSAEVTFDLDNKDISSVITLPSTSVGEDNNGKYVYVLSQQAASEGSNKKLYDVKRQTVSIGKLNSQGFQLLSGVKAGTLIATAGLNTLQDGDVVTLYNAKKD